LSIHRFVIPLIFLSLLCTLTACKSARDRAGNPDAAGLQDAGFDEGMSCAGDGCMQDAGGDAGRTDAARQDAAEQDAGGQDAGSDGATGCTGDLGCQSCSEHTECTMSNVCLPDGTCADSTQVAYVDPSGSDNAQCSKMNPCTKVMAALATNRPYVKFHGTTDEVVTISQNVTLLADPGAKLTKTSYVPGIGAILSVDGSPQAVRVAIYDLEVTGAVVPYWWGIFLYSTQDTLELHRAKVTNNAGGGIAGYGGKAVTISQSTVTGNGSGYTACTYYGDGSGIFVMETTLTISESTFSDNRCFGIYLFGHGITISQCKINGNTISKNKAGGLDVLHATNVDIENNFFFANGSGTSLAGGVIVEHITPADPPVPSRIEFNSFNQNLSNDGIGSAIHCDTGVTLSARNNIMSDNGTSTNMEQVGGPCTHTYSIVQPGTLPPGIGNIAMDPKFENTATGDLHLQSGSPLSPAAGAAEPNLDLTGISAYDIDGDPRTNPADIGADEIP
jgi:hypothetical protein